MGGNDMSLYLLLDEVITVETQPELTWILIPVCLAAAAIGFFIIRAIRKRKLSEAEKREDGR